MTDSKYVEELKKYDYVQYVIPDINTIPRVKIMCGQFKEKVAKNGYKTGVGKSFTCTTDKIGILIKTTKYCVVKVVT